MARNLKLEVMLGAVDKLTAPMKKITKGTDKTATALRESRDELKRLQRTQGDLESFTKLKRSSSESARAMEEQQRTVAQLTQELRTTEGPTRRLTQQREKAIRQARKLKDQYEGEQRQLQTLRTRVRNVEGVTGTYAERQRHLADKIRQANTRMEQQQNQLKQVERRQKRATEAAEKYQRVLGRGQRIAGQGAMGTAVGGGAAVAMGAQAMINQTSGARLAAQQGEGGAEADRYREVITNVYTTGRGEGLEQVTQAVSILASQFESLGETSNAELQAITAQALTLSDAFGIDIAQAAQTAGIMVQNGLAKNATEAYDLMTRGMQEVSASMRDELPEILQEYGTNFRALGFDGRESLNMLVAAAEQGRYALDKTGDALKEFTIRGSDMSKASVEAYDAIGLNAQEMADAIASGGDQASGALTTTAQRLLEIEDPARRANTAIALFGTPIEDLSVDQIPAFLRGLGQTNDRIKEVTGSTAAMGDTLGDNAGSALKRVQRALGGAFMSVLDEVDDTIIRISNSVTSWMKANPELTSTLTKAAIALAAIVAVGGMLLVVIGSLLGPLALIRYGAALLGPTFMGAGKALLWMGGALKAVGMFMLANPIGIAIAAIAAAAFLIYKYWDPIKAFFTGLWQQVKAAFNEGIDGVSRLLVNWSPFGLLWSGISSAMGRLGIELPTSLSALGAKMIGGLVSGIKGALATARQAAASVWGEISGAFSEGIAGVARLLISWSPLGLLWRSISTALESLGISIPEGFSNLGSMIVDGLIGGITGKFGELRDSVTGMASSVTGWFKDVLDINSPSRVFAEFGGNITQGLSGGIEDDVDSPLKQVRNLAGNLRNAAGGLILGAGLSTGAVSADTSPIQLDTRPPLQSAAGQSSGGLVIQGGINIKVHATPGMDEQALARLVNEQVQRALQQAQQQAAAANRRNFHDND
ncbi:hypothetical protein HZS80_21010 [Halomonas glaciei]|uniref:Phage tail tape measure protein domain-containing protein n=1 Tax=Vreelandella glaciei TaxID=186761 RepID=A0A7Z0S0W7_9GAMM|nr:phage tail tape measure protein [Halomonas glaciei]NYS80148.1 hypothetical protein [Halomonas glaciei]